MKDLPYFLTLVKKNLILWSIISTSSFSNIDLKNTSHFFMTDQFLILKHYSLNKDEKFKEIWVTTSKEMTQLIFRSKSSKYLDNTKFYFGRESILTDHSSFNLNGQDIKNTEKYLGSFDMGLDVPAYVVIRHSSYLGYEVYVAFSRIKYDLKSDSTKK